MLESCSEASRSQTEKERERPKESNTSSNRTFALSPTHSAADFLGSLSPHGISIRQGEKEEGLEGIMQRRKEEALDKVVAAVDEESEAGSLARAHNCHDAEERK